MSCIHHIAEAVHAVREAKKRIDFKTRPGATFFSKQDVWLYDARLDSKVCPVCRGYEDMNSAMDGFSGNFIRAMFPYLVILDENTIGGQGDGGDGLSHINCRCRMYRYIGKPDEPEPKIPDTINPQWIPFVLFGSDDEPFGKYDNLSHCIVDQKKRFDLSTKDATKKCLGIRKKALSWV